MKSKKLLFISSVILAYGLNNVNAQVVQFKNQVNVSFNGGKNHNVIYGVQDNVRQALLT